MADGDLWFFDRVARLYRLAMPGADPEPLGQGLAIATRPIDRIADIGGGTCRAIQALAPETGVVIDASAGMLELVSKPSVGVQASATALPVVDEIFDAILIVDALHHIPDIDRVLTECHRVLAPGGVLVVRDFDPATIRERALAAAEHAIGMSSRFFTEDPRRKRRAPARG
ncbi:MAG: class I SAM-dependent methyltransferase [Halobacteriales archaeon]